MQEELKCDICQTSKPKDEINHHSASGINQCKNIISCRDAQRKAARAALAKAEARSCDKCLQQNCDIEYEQTVEDEGFPCFVDKEEITDAKA